MTKPVAHQFEDALGKLVDDYLLLGVEPADIVKVLQYEAAHDLDQRLSDVLRFQVRNSDEYSPTVKRVMEKFHDDLDKRRTRHPSLNR